MRQRTKVIMETDITKGIKGGSGTVAFSGLALSND
jgi:hypothetical protein